MSAKYALLSFVLASCMTLASAQTPCDAIVRAHVANLQAKIKEHAGLGTFNDFKEGQNYVDALKADTAPTGVLDPAIANEAAELNADLNWNDTPCLVELIIEAKAKAAPLEQITQDLKATFQQIGSSSGAGGSTNLVSKGTTAQVLSLAEQFGALTESTSGSTATVQGSLGGVPTALFNKNIEAICTGANKLCIRASTVNALNRISYSIGFDTSQSSQSVSGTAVSSTSSTTAQQVTFEANSHTLNSATAKAVLIPGPATNAASVTQAIAKLTSTSPPTSTDAKVVAAHNLLLKDCPELDPSNLTVNPWIQNSFLTLLKQDPTQVDNFANTWNGLGQSLVSLLDADSTCSPKYLSDSQSVASELSAYVASLNAFFEGLRGTPVLSVEYDFNSPVSQPTNSTIRLIGQLSKSGFTGTLNAAGSFYNSTPSASIPSASRVRDFQVAAEGSYGFGQALKKGQTANPFLGTSTASIAYYYQDQTSPAIFNVTPGQPVTGITFTGLPSTATQVYAQRGVINIAQAKFTWIPSKLNINFPVSVTWSNRTELVTSPVWRGQLGISYDFDSLFSKGQ